MVSTTAIVCDVDLHANTSTTTAMYAMAEMMDVNARRQGEGHGDKTAIAMLLLWQQTVTTQVPSKRGRLAQATVGARGRDREGKGAKARGRVRR